MEMPPIALWGVEAALVPLMGGHRNRAFRTVGLARDVVFKSCRRSEAAMDWLVPVQVEARAAGFNATAPIANQVDVGELENQIDETISKGRRKVGN